MTPHASAPALPCGCRPGQPRCTEGRRLRELAWARSRAARTIGHQALWAAEEQAWRAYEAHIVAAIGREEDA